MPCTRKAAAEARRAEWEARLAEAEAAAAENGYYEYDANPYRSVLADDYESAYARRLRGFESPSYNMPSSYINARYSRAFDYVSAYDPAFYNVIVMGDEVWVEPKYITSMLVLRLEYARTVLLDRQLGLEFRLELVVQSLVQPVARSVVRLLVQSVVGAVVGLGSRLARPPALGRLGTGLGARLGTGPPLRSEPSQYRASSESSAPFADVRRRFGVEYQPGLGRRPHVAVGGLSGR